MESSYFHYLKPVITSQHIRRNTSSHTVLKRAVSRPSWGQVVKNLPASAGDTGLIPGPGRSRMAQSNEAHARQLQKPTLLEPTLHKREATKMGSPSTATGE